MKGVVIGAGITLAAPVAALVSRAGGRGGGPRWCPAPVAALVAEIVVAEIVVAEIGAAEIAGDVLPDLTPFRPSRFQSS